MGGAKAQHDLGGQQPRRRSLVTSGVVLFLVALTLRPDIIGVGPLLEPIQRDFGTSRTVVGLLTAIPVLAIGIFSPAAARLGRRIGPERVVAVGLVAISACGALRATAPHVGLLLGFTIGVGAGIAFVQTLLPAIVRVRTPGRIAVVTTVYVLGIQLGAAGGASLSAVLGETVGWRAPLFTFAGVAGAFLVVWLWYSARPEPAAEAAIPPAGRPASLWRHRMVWLLVVVYGSQAFVYFGISSWLPAYLQEQGWTATPAGQAVSLLNVAGLIATLSTPTLLRHAGSVRRALMIAGGLGTAAIVGLLLAPQAGLVLAFTIGLGLGPLLPTILQLPITVTDDVEDTGSVSGIMLGVGYVIAASGPTVLGAVRDLTGSFVPSMWALVGMLLLFLASCVPLSDSRLRRGVRVGGSPS